MGKKALKIIDDLLAPSDTLKITYKGMNPAVIIGMIPELIKNTMKISSKDLLETDIRWDNSAEDVTFYGVWMGKRAEDRWSKTFIRVIIQGNQNSKEKTGQFAMQIKGTLETSYAYSNFFQRWFWFIYNYKFYYEQRRKYIDNGKDDMHEMKEIIQGRFKISQEEN